MDGYSFYLLLIVLQLNISQKLATSSVGTTPVEDKIRDLEIKIAQQNTKIAVQNTKFAIQNAKMADLKTELAEQFNLITELKLKSEYQEHHQDNITTLPPAIDNGIAKTGSLFTRWGRRDCPNNVSQLVYSGITGGSWYNHPGGASEYVCLPPDPTYNVNKHYNGPAWGYMYGAEYESLPQNIQDYKVPCAVCRTSRYSTVLMIPARGECYKGWTEAYRGELVSEYHGHAGSSQYVCLDQNPQTNGTKTNNDGKLMYPVRARCGSLPCPPYEDNTLLTCVVCLK